MTKTIQVVARVIVCVCVCFLATCAVVTADAKPTHWNLLWITADDMNGDSMGWTGSKIGATTHVDEFAKECFKFSEMHVTAPICQPSRSAMMTGRVPHRNGAVGFGPINLDVPTMVEVLSSNGYYTGVLNKVIHMAPAVKFPWDTKEDGSGKNPKLMGEQLATCIKQAKEKGKPFFINANITDPHRPFAGSEADKAGEGGEDGGGKGGKAGKAGKRQMKNQATATQIAPYKPSEIVVPAILEDIPDVRVEMAQYWTSVHRLDLSFAEMLKALKASGEEDRTIVVFLSDHGISAPFSKATLFHDGTRTPTMIRYPGITKTTLDSTDMISSVDIMPSVLELMNVKAPAGLDGRSFVPLLRGEKQEGRDHVFTHVTSLSSQQEYPGRCVRTLTRGLLYNSWPDGKRTFRGEAMAGMTFKAMAAAGKTDARIKARVDQYLYRAPLEFYDLEKDPTERVNLIKDPKYQDEIKKMEALLLAQMEKTSDPLLAGFKKTIGN